MMNDRELLEKAAKAVGFNQQGFIGSRFVVKNGPNPRDDFDPHTWNPLEDDGDAFRLMVELGINPFQGCYVWIEGCECHVDRHEISDMRRAIVRAAAAMVDS